MPRWWLQEAPCMPLNVAITILDCLQLLCWLTHMQVISSNQCSQAAVLCTHALVSLKGSFLWASYSSLDSRLLTMAVRLKSCQTEMITRQNAEWACALHDGCGRPRLSFVCTVHWAVWAAVCRSLDFTWVAVGFLIQIELSSWKVVYIEHADLGWTLNRWKQLWMWANHAIIVEQSLVSNICSIFFSRGLHVPLVEQISANKSLALWRNMTWKYRRTDTQDDYCIAPGLRPPRHNELLHLAYILLLCKNWIVWLPVKEDSRCENVHTNFP